MRFFQVRSIGVLALLLALGACKDDKPAAGTSASAAPAEQHAATTAKPGSYEDWCAEHEVPESQCTRCNPKFIPAFKASNDWCEEHGVPESQCKICNPNLKIERPAKEGS